MISILIVAASLLTQAYFFHDIDNSHTEPEAPILDSHREAAPAGTAAYHSPVESDSSRTAGPSGDR